MVSTMKMNACSVMIRMWKIAQASCSRPAGDVEDDAVTVHQRDEDEDHLAGVHVAEQSQRQRERLGEQVDALEQEVGRDAELAEGLQVSSPAKPPTPLILKL
jgi:hypothetical protein